MDAKVVDGWPQGHEIRILITDSDAAQVNAIRRALIADVPKLAITRVDFNQGVGSKVLTSAPKLVRFKINTKIK